MGKSILEFLKNFVGNFASNPGYSTKKQFFILASFVMFLTPFGLLLFDKVSGSEVLSYLQIVGLGYGVQYLGGKAVEFYQTKKSDE